MNKNQSEIRKMWQGAWRQDYIDVFQKGYLAKDPLLGNSFISKFETLMQTGQPDLGIYKGLSDFYKKHKVRFDSCMQTNHTARKNYHEDYVRDMVPQTLHPAKIIDIGSDNGTITESIKDVFNLKSRDVYILDPYKSVPKGYGFRPLSYRNDGKINARDGYFDFVSGLMVLHHVAEPLALLQDIGRVLSPSGSLLLREINADTRASVIFNRVIDQTFHVVFNGNDDMTPHLGFQSAGSWQKLFNQAGFDVKKTKHQTEGVQSFAPTWFLLQKAPRVKGNVSP